MHASVNVGCQGKSGLGKIYEVILVYGYFDIIISSILPKAAKAHTELQ